MTRFTAVLLSLVCVLLAYVYLRTRPPWVAAPASVLPAPPPAPDQQAQDLYRQAGAVWTAALPNTHIVNFNRPPGSVHPDTGRWLAPYAGALDLLRRARETGWHPGVQSVEVDGNLWRAAICDYRLCALEGRSREALERALDVVAGARRLGSEGAAAWLEQAMQQPDSLLANCSSEDLSWFLGRLDEFEEREPLNSLLLDPLLLERELEVARLSTSRSRELARNLFDHHIEFVVQRRPLALYAWRSDLFERKDASLEFLHSPKVPAWVPVPALLFHSDEYDAYGGVEKLKLGRLTDVLHAELSFQSLRVRVASELFRRRHLRPPADWSDLVPQYLTEVPEDPCVPGAPLQWTRGRVRSLGFDQKAHRRCREVDEGGWDRVNFLLAKPAPMLIERFEQPGGRSAFLVEADGSYVFWKAPFDSAADSLRLDAPLARAYRAALASAAARREPPRPFTLIANGKDRVQLVLPQGLAAPGSPTLQARLNWRADGLWVESSLLPRMPLKKLTALMERADGMASGKP